MTIKEIYHKLDSLAQSVKPMPDDLRKAYEAAAIVLKNLLLHLESHDRDE